MYKQVPTSLNFVDREKAVEKFWEDNNIFKKSMEHRKEGETYTFYDGPPTANGKPHIGHVETRTIKDMIPRYRTMKGYMVPRKAGWDTHGLPVELEVEKMLGLDGKEQIEEYGLAPFIDKCKESVWKYKGMWEDFSRTVGFWADMDNPYVTYDDNFIESEWWALKTIWDKGLLYKGFKIVPYCPRCGTPLSSHEVAQGYKAVKERSAIVRFKVKGEDAYFLAWTTTPWTLPSNVALCVNPTEVYCKVKAADGYTYYMPEALLDKVLGKLGSEETPAYEVLEKYVGKDLEYKEYEPLFACAGEAAAKQKKKAHFVTCDNYVTMSDGTGIVHIAPAFGEDDSRIGRNYELPFVQFVDGKGDLTNVSFLLRNDTDGVYVIAEQRDGMYYVKGFTDKKIDATTFVPNGSGHIIVNGLEDDTYTLTEIATDKGYVLLKDGIEIFITAAEGESACEICGAKLLTASGSVNGDAVDMEDGNAIVPLTVINNPGFDLPKTGGYGTWMFTVGGCMLLGVAAFIVVRGRKHNRNDQ